MLDRQLQSDDLKGIVASLFYLESEARKSGYQEISLIFRRTISDMDKWINKRMLDRSLYYSEMIDSDLYNILLLLEKVSIANRFDLKSFFKAIEAYETMRERAN